jgi:hypothetical protein
LLAFASRQCAWNDQTENTWAGFGEKKEVMIEKSDEDLLSDLRLVVVRAMVSSVFGGVLKSGVDVDISRKGSSQDRVGLRFAKRRLICSPIRPATKLLSAIHEGNIRGGLSRQLVQYCKRKFWNLVPSQTIRTM